MNIEVQTRQHFYDLCSLGNTPEIQSFLQKHPDIDIYHHEMWAFRLACRNHHESLMDYFLSYPQIQHSDHTYTYINLSCLEAANNNHLVGFQFFWGHQKYQSYIDLYYEEGHVFKTVYNKNNKEFLKYLIIDAQISLEHPAIDAFMNKQNKFYELSQHFTRPSYSFYQDCIELFKIQSLKNQLDKNLTHKENHTTINKI